MAIGCGAKCAKFLLIVFNFFFWLSGVAILGVGIWICVDKTVINYLEVLTIDKNDPVINYAAYVLIGVGVFVFAVGFLGCCGAIKESKCMLGLYMLCLVLVMAGEIAAGVLAVIYRSKVESKLKGHMKDTITQNYMNATVIGNAWDFAQIKLKCCGAMGPSDYQNSKYRNMTGHPVPPSCCVAKDNDNDIEKFKPKDYVACQADAAKTTSDNLNIKGCAQSLEDWFKGHLVTVIGIGLGIACLEIFGLIFAICLCRNVGEEE